jgi:1,4-alpha-glucan branching enzyme
MTTKATKTTPRTMTTKADATPAASSHRLGDADLHLFNEGTHTRLYDKMGAHLCTEDGVRGARFAVWAPNAARVSVIGNFNGWERGKTPLHARGNSGIWEGFVPGVERGEVYKYHIESHHRGYRVDKADPFGAYHEIPPQTASVVWDLDYEWNDGEWMRSRAGRNSLSSPMSIYEVHLGSWKRVPEEGNRSLTYREIAPQLADYAAEHGFTHVELMPMSEHPFAGSWGYQVTGYFAPTSRFGTPQDFMYLVDTLHQRGIGVIVDWVPAHFPTDEHGLGYFDGTHLYEHGDPRKGFHPDWKSFIFNYDRHEVRSFLLSSAIMWLDRYHIDGLRVDGVASMLYLDYSREAGEWIPNEYGGNENLGAISLLRAFNEAVYATFPDVQTIAEESTAWPMVSRPTYLGGLGFGLKWDMGWMHDTLEYFKREPIYRKYHQDQLTFRAIYAFNENFVLPLSHDEVVHGKGSILDRMPGDRWQRLANVRLLYTYMFAQPGKKMLFMGDEFAQEREWNHDSSLDWHVLADPLHQGVRRLVGDLNRVYRSERALHELDVSPEGFEWIDTHDAESSVLVFGRRGPSPGEYVLAAFNLTPVPRTGYRIGVPIAGRWRELLNSDAELYGGSGLGNLGGKDSEELAAHGRPRSIAVTLPPLAGVLFKHERSS